MGTSQAHEFAVLRGERQSRAQLRPALLRLARGIEARAQSADESSIDFVRSAIQAIRKTGPSYEPELQYRCLTAAVPFFYGNARLEFGLSAARDMLAVAKVLGRKELIRKAANCLGVFEKTLGNFTDAVATFQDALTLAHELGDEFAQVAVTANLGATFLEAGMYKESMACFRRVDSLCGVRSNYAELRAASYVNLSQLLLFIGDRSGAYEAAQLSLSLWQEPRSLVDYASCSLRKAHYVYLNLELGNAQEAEVHANDCRRYALESPTATCQFFGKVSNGLIQVALQNPAVGLSLLEEAREQARAFRLASAYEDAWISLSWAYEQLYRPKEALQCLEALRGLLLDRRKAAIKAMLRASSARDELGTDFLALNYRRARLQAEALKAEHDESQIDLLDRLAAAATLRDDSSGLHGRRVGRLAALIASKMGWDPHKCWSIEICARLHDIGKSALPDHVLLTAHTLRDTERTFLKSHTSVGHALLSNSVSAQIMQAAEIALHHHERWDGSGYPNGLASTRIPMSARIVALADVFDALTHGRPYAEPWSVERAIAEIRALSGKHFDPTLVPIFIELVSGLGRDSSQIDAALHADTSAFELARRKIQMIVAGMHVLSPRNMSN